MKIILFICLALFTVLVITSLMVFLIAVGRKTNKRIVFKNKQIQSNEHRQAPSWVYDFAKIQCVSDDGLVLSGYIKQSNESEPWIIFAHGYSGNVSNMVPYIEHFIEQNYNILAIELRAHGDSKGKYYGLGYLDSFDIISWIKLLRAKGHNSKVVLFGISMGGAASIRAACNNTDVSAVISDSAPSNMKTIFSRLISHKEVFLGNLMVNLTDFWLKVFVGFSFKNTDLINDIKNIQVPILLIHGDDDGFVPVSMANEMFDCVADKKEKLIIKDADHTKAAYINPHLYWKTVDEFLHKWIS